MCHKFRNLKEISIFATEAKDITNDFPRAPTEDEDKFPMLTKIKIMFDCKYDEENAMENFHNYLIAKCPKVENPIQIERKNKDIRCRYFKYTFESK